MTSQEELMKIKILYQQGYSERAIAKQLGISRNTAKRYLSENINEPVYAQIICRMPRPTQNYVHFSYYFANSI